MSSYDVQRLDGRLFCIAMYPYLRCFGSLPDIAVKVQSLSSAQTHQRNKAYVLQST